MKKLLLVILLLSQAVLLRAWQPRFSYGLEWGYTATFLKSSQHNFICNEGYRIIDEASAACFYSNGAVMAFGGADLFDVLNVSFGSGVLGVYSRRWVVPLELRAKWCPAGLRSNGFLLQAASAVTFPTTSLHESGIRALAGVGYRIALYRNLSLDLLLSWNFTLDHENITDPDTKNSVPRWMITPNTTEYQGVNFSVALNF